MAPRKNQPDYEVLYNATVEKLNEVLKRVNELEEEEEAFKTLGMSKERAFESEEIMSQQGMTIKKQERELHVLQLELEKMMEARECAIVSTTMLQSNAQQAQEEAERYEETIFELEQKLEKVSNINHLVQNDLLRQKNDLQEVREHNKYLQNCLEEQEVRKEEEKKILQQSMLTYEQEINNLKKQMEQEEQKREEQCE